MLSIKPLPLPLRVTIAPVSLLMYCKLAPPGPITFDLTSNVGGAPSRPTNTFSYMEIIRLQTNKIIAQTVKLTLQNTYTNRIILITNTKQIILKEVQNNLGSKQETC